MITNDCNLNILNISNFDHIIHMKQKSIMAFFLGAVLVLTLSSAQVAFADSSNDDYDDDKYEHDYDDNYDRENEREYEREYESERDDDDDDKYEKERRS